MQIKRRGSGVMLNKAEEVRLMKEKKAYVGKQYLTKEEQLERDLGKVTLKVYLENVKGITIKEALVKSGKPRQTLENWLKSDRVMLNCVVDAVKFDRMRFISVDGDIL